MSSSSSSIVSGILFVAAAAGAVWAAPAAPREEAEQPVLPPPPTAAAMLAVSLGRHAAAADVAWMRTVQFIGAPQSERLHYAGIDAWFELVNALDPTFELPYYHGSILLSTEPAQSENALAILARGERNLVSDACREEVGCPSIDRASRETMFASCAPCPALVEQQCNWALPMAAAFVHYFGQLDAAAAAESFCKSSRRGGPYVTQHRAATLLHETSTCAGVRAELVRMMQTGETGGGADLLSQNRLRVALHCEEETIAQAISAFRVRFRTNAQSVDQLLEAGLLKQPPWSPDPGACWQIVRGDPELGACPP